MVSGGRAEARGAEPEWVLVADAVHGPRAHVGEACFSRKPVSASALRLEAGRLEARPPPPGLAGREVLRALFVSATQGNAPRAIGRVHIVTQAEVLTG